MQTRKKSKVRWLAMACLVAAALLLMQCTRTLKCVNDVVKHLDEEKPGGDLAIDVTLLLHCTLLHGIYLFKT